MWKGVKEREKEKRKLSEVESTYTVMENKDAGEDAEEVCCEQRQVDWGCTAPLHHKGHYAVQRKHAETVTREQQPWEHKPQGNTAVKV